MSIFADIFSIRRRETCSSNPPAKASADEKNRIRRRSLTAKYQTFLSNISQDFRTAVVQDDSGYQKSHKPADVIIPQVPASKSIPIETVTPVTVIEPQESQNPAKVPEVSEVPQIPQVPEVPEIPEQPARLRRRPKTPIRRIGELEGYTEQAMNERCTGSTEGAEANRETRTKTASPTTPKSLRKVGGQHDLRRTSLDSDDAPKSPNFSDVDTIVGSESPPISARRRRNDSNYSFRSSGSWSSNSTSSFYSVTSEKDFAIPEAKDGTAPMKASNINQDICTKPLDFAHNIEMQICLDLLKQDLSSALSPKNPSDSTLALQIWLMIESYESMKQRLQQQLLKQNGLGSKKTSEFTFQALDHWLEALYSVYNLQLEDCRPPARNSHVTV